MIDFEDVAFLCFLISSLVLLGCFIYMMVLQIWPLFLRATTIEQISCVAGIVCFLSICTIFFLENKND